MKCQARLCLPLLLLTASCSILPAAEKPTCAVLTFDAQAGVAKTEAEMLTERFALEFENLGQYQLISRTKMKEALAIRQFARPDNCPATEYAVAAGKILSAQFVVYGAVGKLGRTWTVNAALVNVGTAAVERQADYDNEKSDDLERFGMAAVARQLAGAASADPGADAGRYEDVQDLLARVRDQEAEAKRLEQQQQAVEGLRVEILARLKAEFEKQYAEYRKIAESAQADRAVKRAAWRRITEAWAVKEPGKEPRGLMFNEKTGLLKVTGLSGLGGEALTVDMDGGPASSGAEGVKMELVWITALKIWVGKYEVTNGEYRKYKPEHDSGYFNGRNLNGDRQPAVQVNFNDAQAYAAWLTEQCRGGSMSRIPAGYRFRLPSEQEWMAFAQCGDGLEYPWGNNWPPRSGEAGNYADAAAKVFGWNVIESYNDGHAVSCDVEQSWCNPWGLYGVGGNVWEVTASGSDGASFGAWRGASWGNDVRVTLSCACRLNFGLASRGTYFGFRLVLAPASP